MCANKNPALMKLEITYFRLHKKIVSKYFVLAMNYNRLESFISYRFILPSILQLSINH